MSETINFKQLPDRFRRLARRVVPILILLHLYLGWQLLRDLPFTALTYPLGALFLLASCVLMPFGLFARFVVSSEKLADRLSLWGYIAMGVFSTLFILTVLRHLSFIFYSTDAYKSGSALVVIGLTVVVSVLGFYNATRIAGVKQVTVELDGLPEALRGFCIVQLSDVHVGPSIKANDVRGIVDAVNRLNADLIAITGDVVDGSVESLSQHTAPLADLRSRHGTYFVTGNHEYYSGAKEWVAEFQRIGLTCLMNEHVILTHGDAHMMIAGITDFTAHHFIDEHRSDPEKAIVSDAGHGDRPEVDIDCLHKILLAHQPRSGVAAEKAGFNLQLSGHTHGGQFWPWNLFVPLQQPFVAGLHRLGQIWVYTSRGTGYWGPPKRFGARSEITRIVLQSTQEVVQETT